MRRTPKAFTLVEALVVVALIVLLIALLVPVLNTARRYARRGQCASTLKQLYYGYRTTSMDDNQNRWLNNYSGYSGYSNPTARYWTARIRTFAFGLPFSNALMRNGYTKAQFEAEGGKRFVCPEDQEYAVAQPPQSLSPLSKSDMGWNWGWGFDQGYYSLQNYASYANNQSAMGYSSPPRITDCPPISIYQYPSRTYLLLEMQAYSGPHSEDGYTYTVYSSIMISGGGINYPTPGYDNFGYTRHMGVGNVVYMDGSVATQTRTQALYYNPEPNSGYPNWPYPGSDAYIRWGGTDSSSSYEFWLN